MQADILTQQLFGMNANHRTLMKRLPHFTHLILCFRRFRAMLWLALAAAGAFAAPAAAASLSVAQLRCEYLVNPLGIDTRNRG